MFRWNNRHDMIVVERFLLHEEEVKYAVRVLHSLDYKPGEQYMNDTLLMTRIVQGFTRGCTVETCVREIREENKELMEYA